MSKLFDVIGRTQDSELIADAWGADPITVPMEPGNGVIERGTILYRKANGMYAPATTSQMSANYDLCVLNEQVDTDANMAVAEDANAFRAGHFIIGKVIFKDGTTLTDAYALVLRQQNILLDRTMDGVTFENGRTTITYKANNDATPAEADYPDYADVGASYTILGNTTTKFTAPSGKEFEKWNTKADGQGTDYAAAATYTADEDLTLYAVWKTSGT